MAKTTHAAPGTLTSVVTTELNSLATATDSGASPLYDNTSNLDLYADVVLDLAVQGAARSAGATIKVYLLESVDGGTTYARTSSGTNDPWAVFQLDAATTATYAVKPDRPIPPTKFKLMVRNETGQSLAASGSLIRILPHSIQTV